MSDFHARLAALQRAGFPEALGDDVCEIDMHGITEGMEWMADEIDRLRDALIWCSGAPSFQEGGEARDGWLKIAPLISGNQ